MWYSGYTGELPLPSGRCGPREVGLYDGMSSPPQGSCDSCSISITMAPLPTGS